MATAFQKIYTKISQITKATCSLKATGVGNDELATINGKLAQVVKIMGDDVTLSVKRAGEHMPRYADGSKGPICNDVSGEQYMGVCQFTARNSVRERRQRLE